MAKANKYKLLVPKKDAADQWIPIYKEKFIAYGRPDQDTRDIRGTLFDKDNNPFDGKLLQLDNNFWAIVFEGYSNPNYLLRIEWTLKDGTARSQDYPNIPEKARQGQAASAASGVTIALPAVNDTVPCTFCATGSTTYQADISGTVSRGAYSQTGNVLSQPGTTGVWCIQFSNVPPNSGYTVRVEIAGDNDESTGIVVEC